MNRRDVALIAHFDAMQARWDAHFDAMEARWDARLVAFEARLDKRFDKIDDSIEQLRADVAGLKVDAHHHDEE